MQFIYSRFSILDVMIAFYYTFQKVYTIFHCIRKNTFEEDVGMFVILVDRLINANDRFHGKYLRLVRLLM